MKTKDMYVKVHEAAEILGVAPNTIRKWGAEGKIPEQGWIAFVANWSAKFSEKFAGEALKNEVVLN